MTEKIFGGHRHPYKPKMALARKCPVKVSRLSPNPYSQLPRDMSKIRHVEKSEIRHPGRKFLFFQKQKFRIQLYSSPNLPFLRPSSRFPPTPRKTRFSKNQFLCENSFSSEKLLLFYTWKYQFYRNLTNFTKKVIP